MKELDALIAENNRLWHGEIHVATKEEMKILAEEVREEKWKLHLRQKAKWNE